MADFNFKSNMKFTKKDILLLIDEFIADDKQFINKHADLGYVKNFHEGKIMALEVCRKLIEEHL